MCCLRNLFSRVKKLFAPTWNGKTSKYLNREINFFSQRRLNSFKSANPLNGRLFLASHENFPVCCKYLTRLWVTRPLCLLQNFKRCAQEKGKCRSVSWLEKNLDPRWLQQHFSMLRPTSTGFIEISFSVFREKLWDITLNDSLVKISFLRTVGDTRRQPLIKESFAR